LSAEAVSAKAEGPSWQCGTEALAEPERRPTLFVGAKNISPLQTGERPALILALTEFENFSPMNYEVYLFMVNNKLNKTSSFLSE
jgi:hypothetical protein